jgi:site-specific DNA-methyltransferase (adenine-specific)
MTCTRKIGPFACCSVVQGDCLELMKLLPDGSVDAVITDPPYGIGRDGSLRTTSRHGGRKAYEFRGWDSVRPSEDIFNHILRIGKEAVIWGGNYFADLLPPMQKWLVWDKGQRIMQSDCELAWTSFDGAMRIFTLNRVALMLDGAEHPTQKPLELISWCIAQAEFPETILDPFLGSGTTAVAAKKLGRHFLGFEISEEYCRIARERIAIVEAQPNLFEKRAEQLNLA